MGCFSCSGNSDKRIVKKRSYNYIDKYLQNERDYQTQNERDYQTQPISDILNSHPSKNDEELRMRKDPEFVDKSFARKVSDAEDVVTDGIKAETFTFYQLVAATENFKSDYFLGEGGFGKVYKGVLVDSGQVVAIKQLNHHGSQGIREFIVEVSTLGQCEHTNLVKLIGYCAEGDQRLLVYEYMPLGSLEDHLHGFCPDMRRLDWNTRMKIAAGAARGLEYLHNKIKPPIIYRDLKCSNILLDEGYHPKLSDFGLAKVGPEGDETHVSTRVMGTYGYCAPDYAMTGQLTFKSDIYSFGVVLLEIITGRRAIDFTRSATEQNLVSWARPLFKDRKNFLQMADPALKGQYPVRGLYQAIAIAALCVQEQPSMRPQATDVVTALNYLASQPHDPQNRPVQGPQRVPTSYRKIKDDNQKLLAGNEQERTKLGD